MTTDVTTVLSTSTMTAAASILWSIPSQSDKGLERSLGREEGHRTRGRTAFSTVCHVPANIQATSAVEFDLWYGVRRAHVALVCRCYIYLEIAESLKNNGSKS